MDTSTHPPVVTDVEYLLDAPVEADLIESFPVFLISVALAEALTSAGLSGFELEDARVLPSLEYREAFDEAPHKEYRRLCPSDGEAADSWLDKQFRLCVSDRMMDVLERFDLSGCDSEPTTDP